MPKAMRTCSGKLNGVLFLPLAENGDSFLHVGKRVLERFLLQLR